MKLTARDEDWRELILADIDDAEREAMLVVPTSDYDFAVGKLKADVVAGLRDECVDCELVPGQKSGFGLVVQDATPRELELFDREVEAARVKCREAIRGYLRSINRNGGRRGG